jgi:hypothetical protein
MDAYLGEHARDDEDKKRLIYLVAIIVINSPDEISFYDVL